MKSKSSAKMKAPTEEARRPSAESSAANAGTDQKAVKSKDRAHKRDVAIGPAPDNSDNRIRRYVSNFNWARWSPRRKENIKQMKKVLPWLRRQRLSPLELLLGGVIVVGAIYLGVLLFSGPTRPRMDTPAVFTFKTGKTNGKIPTSLMTLLVGFQKFTDLVRLDIGELRAKQARIDRLLKKINDRLGRLEAKPVRPTGGGDTVPHTGASTPPAVTPALSSSGMSRRLADLERTVDELRTRLDRMGPLKNPGGRKINQRLKAQDVRIRQLGNMIKRQEQLIKSLRKQLRAASKRSGNP